MIKKCSIFILIVIALMSACQPTPDEPVVIDKNDLEQKIMQTATPQQSQQVEQLTLQETLDFQSGVQVVIDADIEQPQVKAYSVYEVKPHETTLDEAKTFSYFFLQGLPLYEYNYVRTKTDIEMDIMIIRTLLNDTRKSMTVGSEEIRQMNIDSLTDQLDKLEDEYAKVPEKAPEPKPTTVGFTEDPYFYKTMRLKAFLDDNPSYFSIVIYDTHESYMCFLYNIPESYGMIDRYVWSFHATDVLLGVNITRLDAQAEAEKLLNELGLNDFQLEWAEAKAEFDLKSSTIPSVSELTNNPDIRKCFAFHYSHMYNGIPAMHIQPCYGMESESGAQYDRPWSPEEIIIYVDDSGIVGFQWISPGDIVRTINDNVKLKDFKAIKEVFMKQLFYQRTWANPGTKNNKITIKTIKLNLMRVKIKDENKHYLLPVWDFIGDWKRTEGSNDINTENVSFMTINAIDGSVIDRNLGY